MHSGAMVPDGSIEGLRRMGAILALLALVLLTVLGQPAQARTVLDVSAPAAIEQSHAGDPDGGHHPPGAHCANHCAGHATGPASEPAIDQAPPHTLRFAPAEQIEPEAVSARPPIRPPAA